MKVRVAARFRLPIAGSGPAVVIGDDLWIALLREPTKGIQATMNPGHLIDLDTRTGHVKRISEIGSFPTGIVTSDHHIWIATTPGDLHPPALERDIVTELDRSGSIIRRYHVHDPEAITPAENGVWVTSFTGRDGTGLRHLHDGHADPSFSLQDAIGGDRPMLARADHGVFAITNDTITRITAQGKSVQTTRTPGRVAGAATTRRKIWLLSPPGKHQRSTLTAVDPRTGVSAEPRSVPAAASITGDGTDLWTISADGRVFKIETY